MKCCAECFGDTGLRKSIIPLRATETGRCSYCDSGNVRLISPSGLAEYFELVISAYEPNADGKLLIDWFREDWGLFEHPRMDDPRVIDLLADILGNAEIVQQLFVPAQDLSGDRLTQWEQLRDELMYRNRFFPDVNIDLDRLEFLLSQLTIEGNAVPSLWYRARIQISDRPFVIAEMGAPPKRVASYGRANPAGIPYLYLGSTPEAAVCEIRPHTGETACVADFRAPDGLKLVDLRQPKKLVSPFLLADAQSITKMRTDLPFLERLGDELTRPVVPQ